MESKESDILLCADHGPASAAPRNPTYQEEPTHIVSKAPHCFIAHNESHNKGAMKFRSAGNLEKPQAQLPAQTVLQMYLISIKQKQNKTKKLR